MSAPEPIKVELPAYIPATVPSDSTPAAPVSVTTTLFTPPPAKIYKTEQNAASAQATPPLRIKIQSQQAILSTPTAASVVTNVTERERVDTPSTASATAAAANASKGKTPTKLPEEFWRDLQQFHERRGTPITHPPKVSGQPIDLYKLYNEVTERGGFNKVNNRDEWDEVYSALETLRERCVNGTAGIKYIYRRFLDKYERLNFFGEDPDKMEALEAAIESAELGSSRSRSRYSSSLSSIFGHPTSVLTAVPMSYNYRQHNVNMDRRRQFKMSTDLHKGSSYEKLLLSLISPLPNEQDFAINVCTLMTNEAKHTLRLSECPKIIDVLLAHMGVYADYSLRQLFQHVYTNIRRHSQHAFWRDLLHEKPQVLELFSDEQAWLDSGLVPRERVAKEKEQEAQRAALLDDCFELDFLNLRRGEGTHDYMGQRVLQVVQILRCVSFFDENLQILAKNRTLWRFLVMGASVRWSNIHIHTLETAGNIATEFELCDPSTDELSRNLMAMLSEGVESSDRAVIINCLEILYKLCTREGNEQYVIRCLNQDFYDRLCLMLSLNDVMLLIFTLEAIYALTSLGARACSQLMQVRGIVDQLVSLITVEAQSYGPDGCILMRVVEIVPGNMLPIVAQNIANLQNVSNVKHHHQMQPPPPPPPPAAVLPPPQPILSQHHIDMLQQQQQQQPQPQQQQPPPPPPAAPQLQQQQQQQSTQQPQSQPSNEPPPPPALPLPMPMPVPVPTALLPHPSLPQVQLPPHLVATSALMPTLPTPMPMAMPQQALPQLQPQSFTQDDDQYALNWLSATFERAASNESHVEQQEVYRMYLAHCQKSGKHSVVNHLQFPRLVRLIFNQNTGPLIVRRPDGIELPGYHYVGIRMRAPPLPIHCKPPAMTATLTMTTTAAASTTSAAVLTMAPAAASAAAAPNSTKAEPMRKKKKLKLEPTQPHLVAVGSSAESNLASVVVEATSATTATMADISKAETAHAETAAQSALSALVDAKELPITEILEATMANPTPPQQQQQQQQQQQTQQHSTSSLIKSLLANKVNQRQQKQKELVTSASIISAAAATATASQPPQLQLSTHAQLSQQPIKVTSNAISALVNNPLMQHTPVKVGQTTIKPLNPQLTLEKKTIITDSAPPPLAPLSGTTNVVTKDASGRTVIIANQSLVELPNTIIKRKMTIDENMESIKRVALDSGGALVMAAKEETQVTPSKNAANLYAEMAASILEDEDLADIPPLTSTSLPSQLMQQQQHHQQQQQQQQPQQLEPQPPQLPPPQLKLQLPAPPSSVSSTLQSMQRQILFQTNAQGQHTGGAQLKLAGSGGTQQIPTAMATIKTDQGLQTVPVILQTKALEQGQPQLIQQMLQQTNPQPPQQTQYVLATNQQGQTYLVAQQPTPPPQPQATQTVLVTQTPQQQSAGTKTIIILQQQTPGQSPQQQQQQQQLITTGPGGHQKMIMTTAQGQQVLVTQRPPTPQQQILINAQTGTPILQRTQTPQHQHQQQQQHHQHQQQQQQHHQQQQQQSVSSAAAAGQISPSLLSQLNQIPATIKLHQPQPTLSQQQAGLSAMPRLSSKSMPPPPPSMQMPPQLQQHQSIIQQHIISGPAEKRMLIGSGRALEIKETLITQTAQPAQQSQLNSQTIITTQPAVQTTSAVQQHIRAVIEQQQQQQQPHAHPSIIQQKITVPIGVHQHQQQQQQQQLQVTSSQMHNELPSLVQTSNVIVGTALPSHKVHVPATIAAGATTVTAGGTTTPKRSQETYVIKSTAQTATITSVPAPAPPHVHAPAPGLASTTTTTTSASAAAAAVTIAPITMASTQIATNVAPHKEPMPPAAFSVAKETKPEEKPNPNLHPHPNGSSSHAVGQSTAGVSVITANSSIMSTAATVHMHTTSSTVTMSTSATLPNLNTPAVVSPAPPMLPTDVNWLFICDWRNCPRRKFKTVGELQHHVCTVHCPDHLETAAEIFCQWGTGPGLCDNVPRKRFSLMTHLIDRHLSLDSLRTSVQRRIATGIYNVAPTQPAVTIVRNVEHNQRGSNASPALSTGSSSSSTTTTTTTTTGGAGPLTGTTNLAGSSALHAIKRHTADFVNPKELMDENEGPVTKSIRLTAALILRNLVTYTSTAKRNLRTHEPHLANVALSNVESSSALSQILYELNN